MHKFNNAAKYFIRFLHFTLNLLTNPINSLVIIKIIYQNNSISIDNIRHHLRLNERCYSRRLNFHQRSRIFIDHSRLINCKLGKEFLDSSRQGSLTIWREKFNSRVISIKLTTPKSIHRYEGEMIVALEFDGLRLMVMSFQLCNGDTFGESGNLAFVTRIQGAPSHYDEIRHACKLMSNLNLSYALISALEGFCRSFNIEKIIGIDFAAQTAFLSDSESPNFINTYDKFWLKNQASLMLTGYYLLRLPLLPLDMSPPSGPHRSRTLKHRDIRRSIASTARQSLDDFRASRGLTD